MFEPSHARDLSPVETDCSPVCTALCVPQLSVLCNIQCDTLCNDGAAPPTAESTEAWETLLRIQESHPPRTDTYLCLHNSLDHVRPLRGEQTQIPGQSD